MRHQIEGFGRGTLSLSWELWKELKDHLSYIVTINLLFLYSNNNMSMTKSKHIDIKFLVVREKVQSGQMSIEHISTNSIIAYPLTKGLPPKVFHDHTIHMSVVSIDMSLYSSVIQL